MRWRRLSIVIASLIVVAAGRAVDVSGAGLVGARREVALSGAPAGASERCAVDSLPRLMGDITGRIAALPGAPDLQWNVRIATAREVDGAPLVFLVSAKGEGSNITLELRWLGDAWSWRLTEAALSIEAWREAAMRMRPELSAWTLAGRVRLEGAGQWRTGMPEGWLLIRLNEGRVENAGKKLSVEGIEAAVRVADIAARTSEGGQWISWRGGRYDTLALGAGRVDFGLDAGTLAIGAAVQELLGGCVRIANLRVRPDQSLAALDARAEGIDVSMILPLLPPVVAEAEGKLDGSIRLERTATGLALAEARLSLPSGKSARVRLLPTPGIISNNLPPRVLQHYPGLKRIETGEMPMKADTLDIRLTPQSDAAEKSATVRIEGGPLDPVLKAPLIFDVNVFGPLQPLIRFGTDERLRFGK